MIAAAHAGPPPIHNKLLNQENLTEAIQYCLTQEALNAAADISRKMRAENGVVSAVKSFRQNLPIEAMSCDLIPEEPAVWLYSKSKMNLKLSDKAAVILSEHKKIDAKYLKL
jgi:sterol 3beta-glucosyltransferase